MWYYPLMAQAAYAHQKHRIAKIADLVPHPRNPRQGDVGAIHESIQANGWYGALIVQASTQHVCAGNHRLLALKATGATEVPILELDIPDDVALRILLADNRTNDLATYDDALLLEILIAEAQAGNLVGTGYTGDDVDQLMRDLSTEPPVTSAQLDNVTYRVLIDCTDEQHQGELLARFQSEGLTAKALAQ